MYSTRSKRIMDMVGIPYISDADSNKSPNRRENSGENAFSGANKIDIRENQTADITGTENTDAIDNDDNILDLEDNFLSLNDDEILATSEIIENNLLKGALSYEAQHIHDYVDEGSGKKTSENSEILDRVMEQGQSELEDEGVPGNESSETERDNIQEEEILPEGLNENSINQASKTDHLTSTKRRQQSSHRRLHGQAYVGYKRSEEKIVTHNTARGERTVKNRCAHPVPKKPTNKSFLCGLVDADDRKHIFDTFWRLSSWDAKKVFVTGLVEKRAVRRRRKNALSNETAAKKKEGHDYFLVTKIGKRTKVCRQFFLNTLDLGEDSLKRWTKEGLSSHEFQSTSDSESDTENNPGTSKRLKLSKKVVEKKQVIEVVKKWLDLLPKVPSHYCRASSSKQYVDNSFKSKSHMYRIFKEWSEENNEKVAHFKLFKAILHESKIGIHQPRKDQCDICCGFKTSNISKEEYDAHIKKKNESRAAKATMKESFSDTRLVITVDLQSVLTCPKLLASKTYYKLKLQVHNFTIYALNDRKVTLYVWHETNGGVTSNEFASCLTDYLNTIPENYKTIIIISDGCNYQNRNKTLSSVLSDLCKEKNITVQQLYLEKGHTMMEADSVHSTLEQYFIPPISSPCYYITQMRMARKMNPYKVNNLDFTFFKKYESITNFKSIRPGKKAGDPEVVDRRQLKYLPNDEVYYTLDYSENWLMLPNRRENKPMESYSGLYKKQIPISADKWTHLQDLKGVLDKDHQPFYDALPYEKKK